MKGSVAAVGIFDGVHVGHQKVIRAVVSAARRQGSLALILALEPHPQEVLGLSGPSGRLTTLDEKRDLVLRLGADRFHVLRFTRELAALPAEEFVERTVVGCFGVSVLIMGHDQKLGADRRGDATSLMEWGAPRGIDIMTLEAVTVSDRAHAPGIVSSTAVREALAEGDVAWAATMLGRPYWIAATVVRGNGRGGPEVGFPTANLAPADTGKLLPADGVYAVEVDIREKTWPGVLNVGQRPTFGGGPASVEVHIAGFSGLLYDERLSISFVERLREEMSFSGARALRQQIEKDLKMAVRVIGEKAEVRPCPSLRK